MTYTGQSGNNMKFAIEMPTDEEGMMPLRCPNSSDHEFKMRNLINSDSKESSKLTSSLDNSPVTSIDNDMAVAKEGIYCPYCGIYREDPWDFLPQQKRRVEEAGQAMAEQFAHQAISDMLEKAFGKGSRSSSNRNLGVSISYEKESPPPIRSLHKVRIEETRNTLTCIKCNEIYAVYGLTSYCPQCGLLAPIQMLEQSIKKHRASIQILRDLPSKSLKEYKELGLIDDVYSNTLKDGFGALETYLREFYKDRMGVENKFKQGTFQRLEDAAEIYQRDLLIDLRGLLGSLVWKRLSIFAEIRHVLTHSQGIIDEKFKTKVPDWTQSLNQKIFVSETQIDEFLGILEVLVTGIGSRDQDEE
jgi:hypothetical protein